VVRNLEEHMARRRVTKEAVVTMLTGKGFSETVNTEEVTLRP
jgi:hypothetical protein